MPFCFTAETRSIISSGTVEIFSYMPNSLNTTLRLKGTGKWTVFVIYLLIFLTSVGFPFPSTFLWNPLRTGIIYSLSSQTGQVFSNLIEFDTNYNYTQGLRHVIWKEWKTSKIQNCCLIWKLVFLLLMKDSSEMFFYVSFLKSLPFIPIVAFGIFFLLFLLFLNLLNDVVRTCWL